MQAILLAAGMGKRLLKYTNNNTKCMLNINGELLINRIVNALKKANINKLIIVVGYKKDNLEKYIYDNIHDIDIEFIENDDYDKSNNIYSLYLAIDQLIKDDTILLESDLLYSDNLIKKIIEYPYENVAVVAKYEDWMDGTVTLLDNNNNIKEFLNKKDMNYDIIYKYYKTVNIYKLSKEYSEKYYKPFIETYINTYGKNDYYEEIFKLISQISESKLKAYNLQGEVWYEIDDEQDLRISEVLFSNDIYEKYNNISKAYYGNWKFNNIRYISKYKNAYFPTNSMKNKIKYNFNRLICEAPSNNHIQNISASRIFGIDSKNIILQDKVYLFFSKICKKMAIMGNVIDKDLLDNYENFIFKDEKIKLEEYYKISNYVDGIYLSLQDNVTGEVIPYEKLIKVIDYYNKENKYVVIDETLFDYLDENKKYSILNNDMLEKYKYLIILKDMNRTYGIAGLNLYFIATSNKKILMQNQNFSICSLAEYFIQILPIYKSDYIKSCNMTIDERNRIAECLKGNKNIHIIGCNNLNYILFYTDNIYNLENLLLREGYFIEYIKYDQKKCYIISIDSEENNNKFIDVLNKIFMENNNGKKSC